MFVLRKISLLFLIVIISGHHTTCTKASEGDPIGSKIPSPTPDPAPPKSRAALFSSPVDSLILNDTPQGRSLSTPISILSSILQPIILALAFQQLQQQQQQQQQQPSTQLQQQPSLVQLLQQQLIQQQLVQQQLLRQQLLRQQFGVLQQSRATGTTQTVASRRPSLGGGLSSLGAGQAFGLRLPFGFGSPSSLSRSFRNEQDISSSLDLSSLLQIPSDSRSSLTRFKKSSLDSSDLKKRSEQVAVSRSSTNNAVDRDRQAPDGVRPRLNHPSPLLDSATTLDAGRDPKSQLSLTDNKIRYPLIRALLEAPTSFSQTPLFQNKDSPSIGRLPFQESPNRAIKDDKTSGNSPFDFRQRTSDPRTLDHSLTTFYRNLPLTKQVQNSIQLFLEPQTRNEAEFVASGGPEGGVASPGELTSFDGTAHLLAALLFANNEDLTKEDGRSFSGGEKEDATRKFRFPDE